MSSPFAFSSCFLLPFSFQLFSLSIVIKTEGNSVLILHVRHDSCVKVNLFHPGIRRNVITNPLKLMLTVITARFTSSVIKDFGRCEC